MAIEKLDIFSKEWKNENFDRQITIALKLNEIIDFCNKLEEANNEKKTINMGDIGI